MIAEVLGLYVRVNKLGLRNLAPVIGISHSTLSRITRGETMDAKTMLKIIQWLFSSKASSRGRKAE